MSTDSQPGPQPPTYVINRSRTTDSYTLWQLSPESPSLFRQLPTSPDASFPRRHHLCAVGDYLLDYPPVRIDPNGPPIPYRLRPFDPRSEDPLSGPVMKEDSWRPGKFSGYYDHYTWDPNDDDMLRMIPMAGYVLSFIGSPRHSAFRLWNFDPAPNAAEDVDPLPNPVSPRDVFSVIAGNSRLLPVGNYVLEWLAVGSAYRVWSLDPQAQTPLALPVVSEGRRDDIDVRQELLFLGEDLLIWTPETGEYKLRHFDPTRADPFAQVIRTGKLPQGFGADSNLTAVQGKVPIDSAAAETPGTMDFMRSKIEHLVVYMLESRSMDSVLGWLYAENPPTINFINAEAPFKGTSTDYYNEANCKTFPVYKFKDGALGTDFDLNVPGPGGDPFHSTPDSILQHFSGGYPDYLAGAAADMGGFVSNNNSGEVMATLTPEQLPVLNGLAAAFAVSDYWFSAVPGGTNSNRAFALTGSSFNITTSYQGGGLYEPYKRFPDTPRRQSIWKVLWNNGVADWKIYNAVEWKAVPYTYHLYLKNQCPSIDDKVDDFVASFDRFLEDAANGRLPKFSFVEPAWIAPEGATSYKPTTDLVPGEVALNRLYRAIAEGPAWDKTALLITFSKGGGMYDHVPPPKAVKPWPKDLNDGFGFDVLGPRVPAIIVSPWVEPNSVFRAPGDAPFSATSLPATVLRWLGIPKARWGLGDRVAASPTFEAVFQRSSPRTDLPSFTNPYDKSNPPESGDETG